MQHLKASVQVRRGNGYTAVFLFSTNTAREIRQDIRGANLGEFNFNLVMMEAPSLAFLNIQDWARENVISLNEGESTSIEYEQRVEKKSK